MKNAAKYFLLYFSTTYSLLIISIENFVDLFIFIFIVIFIVFIKYKLTKECVKTNTEIPLIQILIIRDMGLDVEIVSITTKPYIPQKNLLL